MNLLVAVLIYFVLGVTVAVADEPLYQGDRAEDPLQNFTPEAIAGAVKLRDALAGSIWTYHYGNGKFKLGFGRGGDTQLLRSWKRVSWRIVGPRKVILESRNGNHMVLRFDTSLQHFWTKDWDGQKTTGRKTDERLPGEPPPLPKTRSATSWKLAPPRVDLRPEFERRKLGARQQSQRGACQVFAFVGVLEYQLSRPNLPVDLSEQFLMWAANEANNVKRTEGFNPDLLVVGLKKHGVCKETLMPYVPRNEPIAEPSAEAVRQGRELANCKVTSIKHWTSDIGFSLEDIKTICEHLDAGRPVTTTVCWPEGLSDSQIVDANQVLIDRAVNGKSKGGHGVILCGYAPDKNAPGGGYFLFRNSWGSKFADGGYARLTYAYARQYGVDAYIVSPR